MRAHLGWLAVVAIAIAALALWLAGQFRGSSRPGAGPVIMLDPEEVERGAAVYRAHCAHCHGARGEGAADWRRQNPDGTFPPPPHNESGHTWHHGDGVLYRMIRHGGASYESATFRSAMPAFGDRLRPAEIQAVISYLKSLWGPDERGFQARASLSDPFPAAAGAEGSR